jgi:glycosyltransferase involved in cell wall biosynthesis
MVASIKDMLKYPIKYIHQDDIGFRKSLAVNKAILLSSGEYLVFADDDMVAPPKYIDAHLKKLKENNLVLGKYIPVLTGDTLFTEENITSGKYMNRVTFKDLLRLLYWKIKYRLYFIRKNPKRPKLNGGNFSVTKNAIVKVNGIDRDFVGWGYEDDDLRQRLIKSGITLEEVVLSGYNFNLGYEPKNKTISSNSSSEQAAINKKMAYSDSRPWHCKNGIKEILSSGIPNSQDGWLFIWP